MGARSGLALKFLQWFVRGIQFLCAALVLGVYSYFLATLAANDLTITDEVRAVEGISGAAVLYTIIGLLLLCCCAGLTLASLIAIVLDVAFIGAFIFVAWANRNGASDCRGYLDTPFGDGFADETADGSDGFNGLPSYQNACRLQSACLAVSIVAIAFFVFSILMEIALARHHRKEKRFGPSPKNNYTSGYGRAGGFFNRMMRRGGGGAAKDDNALPEHTHPDQVEAGRQSYATETTAVDPAAGYAGRGSGGANPNAHKYDAQGFAQREPQVPGVAETADYGYSHGYGSAPQTTPPQLGGAYRYDDGVYNRF